MEFCTRCGHELGVGRFCTNCGHPIESRNPASPDEWRDDTAERPILPMPPSPPPVGPSPPPVQPGPTGARYPLFADQVPPDQPPPPLTPPPPAQPLPTPHRGSRPAWFVWALVTGLVLVLVATIGTVLLLGGDDPGDETATDTRNADSTSASSEPTRSASSSPSDSSSPSSSSSASGEPDDVAALATVSVPATAPPNEDTSGNLVRYEGRNMLDGVPETCWRMPGDGTGSEITITLAEPTEISRVGLINGYAKTAGTLDWYAGNRRILAVEWVFDDGSVVGQDLTETRDLQPVDVDPVTTSTITLRILKVSKPGKGPAARNYTPISDVELVGTAG